jgi:hypothetical protein
LSSELVDQSTIPMLIWLAVPGNTGKPGNIFRFIRPQSTLFSERIDQLITCLHCRCKRLIAATVPCMAKKDLVLLTIHAFADHESCVDLGNVLH